MMHCCPLLFIHMFYLVSYCAGHSLVSYHYFGSPAAPNGFELVPRLKHRCYAEFGNLFYTTEIKFFCNDREQKRCLWVQEFIPFHQHLDLHLSTSWHKLASARPPHYFYRCCRAWLNVGCLMVPCKASASVRSFNFEHVCSLADLSDKLRIVSQWRLHTNAEPKCEGSGALVKISVNQLKQSEVSD